MSPRVAGETEKSEISQLLCGSNAMTDLEFDAEINELLGRASAGDESAIAEIIQRFEPEIRLIARRQLSAPLRPYVDSMDLVQAVHEDLLVGLREGKFEFASKGHLFALATLLVRRKSARLWRKHRRQQRQSGMRPAPDGLADVILSQQASEDHEFDVSTRDEIQHVLDQLEPDERELIALRLEGYSTADVARQLGWNPDVTRVRLSRLRQRLKNSTWGKSF